MRHNNQEAFTYPAGVTYVTDEADAVYLENTWDVDPTNVTAYKVEGSAITFWRTWTHPVTERVYVTEFWRNAP